MRFFVLCSTNLSNQVHWLIASSYIYRRYCKSFLSSLEDQGKLKNILFHIADGTPSLLLCSMKRTRQKLVNKESGRN